ncbi:DNA gyrase subunit A [Nocardioides aquaticus]|nr:DNA gyrase subunit A [Nocardioides aquaticus]
MSDALRSLRASYGLSDIQAQATLDLQFRRLDQTSQSKIRAELEDIRTELARLTTT